MKIHNITEGYSYISDSNPQPEQKVVDKFARVADSQRSYYIMKWAEEKGMDTDDAMHKAGYVKDGYLGAGAYNWRYVGMGESVEEANNPDAGEYTYTLELNGESQGYTTHTLTITSPEGESKVVADDFTYFEVEGDELQAELHSWFNMGHGVGDESVQEADDEVDTGPTWKDDLEDALDGYPEWAHEYIKDGVCPECGGNGYMDGDYENEDGEENDECNGMYNYDCDEGEIRDNTWADELKSKEPEAPKQPAPSKEEIMKILPRLHDDYVKSGRYNAFELGGILKQMYPELNKREAGSYVADFLSNFKESEELNDLRKRAGLEVKEAEYQGKKVELSKPKRGGSKKFYVYVTDPKTKNVKKVSFGADSGGGKLAVKLKDPKARKAFADRHNCDQKNDKTKAGYWSCRLPRYAKSLGLSGGGTWW
jgi:hypothetical protein